MKRSRIGWLLLVAAFTVFSACNKGAGCPASEASRKMVDVGSNKNATFGEKKTKKTPKSSVMPAEVKYKRPRR